MLGGFISLCSCACFRYLYPSSFAFHDLNSISYTLNNSALTNATVTYSWPLTSIDHVGSSLVNTIIGAQLIFLTALLLHFAYFTVKFI